MILVFGANSFIARNFVDHCEKNGIEYIGVGSTGNDTDIRNYRNTSYTSEDIGSLFSEYEFKKIYIFKSLVRRDILDSNEYKEVNVGILTNLIEAFKEQVVKEKFEIHHFSSAGRYSEKVKMNDHYLNSKKDQEDMLKNFNKSYNNKLFIHKLPNVIGPYDLNFSRITPFYLGSRLMEKDLSFETPLNEGRKFITINTLMDTLQETTYEDTYKEFEYSGDFDIDLAEYIDLLDQSFNYCIGGNKKNIESIENTKIRNHLNFVDWYIKNKKYVINKFNTWFNN
jgi:nucleoside-diphosphate-sugar epimerase